MSSPSTKNNENRRPWLWALLLLLTGVILLLQNFLVLEGFNAVSLLPLVLVVLGAQLIIQGDLLPGSGTRTFGITRGSVEAAALEINAGAIDVVLRPLQREGRLIAGQYAASSRPYLSVDGAYTHLRMDRAATPWTSFADWQMGLARDLPWTIYVSTHLGQISLDCTDLIVQKAILASGVGDIRLTCPYEAFDTLEVHSTLGNITVVTPHGYRVRVHTAGNRLFERRADGNRYAEVAPGIYEALDADASAPQVTVYVRGTFGSVYLV